MIFPVSFMAALLLVLLFPGVSEASARRIESSTSRVILQGTAPELELQAQSFIDAGRRWGALCKPTVRCGSSDGPAPCRLDVSACLPARLRGLLGRTYAQPGPNCFSTALMTAGLSPSARGVDASEMKAYARAFCERVENPRAGDLGIYVSPREAVFSRESLWVHAFMSVTPDFVFEKQGVDYWGATPILLREFSDVDYRVRVTPECRRYAPDPRECANQLVYLRCGSAALPPKLQQAFDQIDQLANQLLDQDFVSSADFSSWDFHTLEIEKQIPAATQLNAVTKDYVHERLRSLKKQREFFRPLPSTHYDLN